MQEFGPEIDETASVPERVKLERFERLREETIAQMKREKEQRLQTNPQPTETELALGVFLEDLEPQVRDALVTMNRKGYSTNSSGFGGYYGQLQVIEGAFTLDEDTKARLQDMEVEVVEQRAWGRMFSNLEFSPDEPDLAQMKQRWDQIAALLPDRGAPALSWPHGDEFRAAYTKKTER